jgi:hypothetical protein
VADVGGTAAELSGIPPAGAGVADTGRMLPWALHHRQPLLADVERARRQIETASELASGRAVVESAPA